MPASRDSRPREHLAVPTLPDMLVGACADYGDRPALTIDSTRRSFDELLEGAISTARSLAALGVRRGARVATFMPNCLEFVETVFGASMLGAVVVPLNSRFRVRELLHVTRDAQPAVIVTLAPRNDRLDHPERLRRMLAELPPEASSPTVVALGEQEDLATSLGMLTRSEFASAALGVDEAEIELARARIRVRDLAAVLYTSGTTANPKGCLHTHEALIRNAIMTGRTRFFLQPDDRFWDPLPMFHVSFLTPMLACVDGGTEMVAMTHFDPGPALDVIEHQRITWVFASFKAIARPLITAPSFSERSFDAVRMTMCVGSTPELRAFQAAFPRAQLLSTYGSTETGGVITYHEPDATAEQRVTTCGTPFRGVEVAIRPLGSSEHLESHGLGEILVRGYSVLDGYLNAPSETAAAVDNEGWLHTGDLGTVDGDGHVRFHGRLKDMIKVGGENVSPAEIEALLAEHPAVAAVNVVAAPDPLLDEVVAAFVELVPGRSASARELIDLCAINLAGYKVPRHVRFVDSWPMSATKVRKDELRARIALDLSSSLPPAHQAS